MATTKKIPSQGNLVDLLAAFGRGALGTLTDRFGQYDAAVESVAAHDTVIEKLTRNKAEWFDAGYITEATCYNIVTGAQQSVTLPLDVSELLNRFRAVASRTRLYTGVRFTVQGKEDICLYLKFAAISPYADSGAVVFEDLQFCYSPTEEGTEDIDVRYKVRTDKSTGHIVLEKMEESASAELPWLEFTVNVDELTSALSEAGARYEINNLSTESIDPSLYRGIKLTDNAGALYYFPFMFHMDDRSDAWCSDFTDADKTWRVTFGSGQNTLVFDDITPAAPDLSDYAKKTDLPQQPMTLLVCGDNGNTTDMNGDTFTLTPTKLKDGSVDYFYVGLTGQMASRLNALFGELNKAQDPHGSDVYVADTNPVNMLPTLMLTFYDGSIAYRFDAIESSPGNGEFKFKGEIRADNGSLATWVAIFFYGAQGKKFEFYLTK